MMSRPPAAPALPRSTAQAQRDFTAEGAPAPPAPGSSSPLPAKPAVAARARPGSRPGTAPHQRDRWGPPSRNGR